MPDLISWGESLGVAALVAAAVALAVAWPGAAPPVWRLRIACLSGLAAGFYAGCGMLGQWPRWPALEDRDRFLVVLLPMALAVEAAAPALIRRRWLAWLLRAGLVGAAAPILLFNSVYLVDLSGPNSAEWGPIQAAFILTALAALLALVWMLLHLLATRTGGHAVPPILALACLAAGMTVMLSGYFKGGLLGLPLAGALCGAGLASRVMARRANVNVNWAGASVGVGAIGLCSVLAVGRFFGSLPTLTALALCLAPLLAWLSHAPGLRKLRPGFRAGLGALLVAVVLSSIVSRAWQKFTRDFSARPAARAPASRDFPSPDP